MAVLGLRFCARAFSSCGSGGHSSQGDFWFLNGGVNDIGVPSLLQSHPATTNRSKTGMQAPTLTKLGNS